MMREKRGKTKRPRDNEKTKRPESGRRPRRRWRD
jgi:hypothetical protein